jgi:predicted lipoprotein with Yx(FWY)xxD motif
MRRIILLATVALLMTAMVALLGAGTVAAHPHVAENSPQDQQIANGQNHPGYTYDADTNLSTSCDPSGTSSDPAFYGLESAHHGPDAGDPGKDEGCYAAHDDDAGATLPPPDANPGID